MPVRILEQIWRIEMRSKQLTPLPAHTPALAPSRNDTPSHLHYDTSGRLTTALTDTNGTVAVAELKRNDFTPVSFSSPPPPLPSAPPLPPLARTTASKSIPHFSCSALLLLLLAEGNLPFVDGIHRSGSYSLPFPLLREVVDETIDR